MHQADPLLLRAAAALREARVARPLGRVLGA